jgi:hypothetical protein
MITFQSTRADGAKEWRRHVPFHVLPDGNRFKAVHAGNGSLLGRYDSRELAERELNCRTELVPHFKPQA